MGEEMSKIYLVGNPNVGKTTFFNFATCSFEHTGNWHGVTVDAKSKNVKFENQMFSLTDLPGIYSTTSFSPEEQVAIDQILKKDGLVVNICDANVLQRNLYLTLCLLECGICPTVIVNFAPQAKKNGNKFDFALLSKLLGISILQNNFAQPKDFFCSVKNFQKQASKSLAAPLPYLNDLPIDEILAALSTQQKSKFDAKFVAIKILEQDEHVVQQLSLLPNQQKILNEICSKKDYPSLIAKLRYDYIKSIIQKATTSITN